MAKEESRNKVMLEAFLSLENLPLSRRKEIASKLSLPENDQKDLLFMSAILVSTGVNSNGAAFLGSELVKAKDSINEKPLNKEHHSEKIVGHISSNLYMTHEGKVLDKEELYKNVMSEDASEKNQAIADLDNTNMDIGIICVVYKDAFPDIAEEIKQGDWKVSMECYYEDFDLKIGNTVVSKASLRQTRDLVKDKATKDAIDKVINGNEVSNLHVSRVLRDIRFCGCAIVKNPAEKRAVILEAATHMKKTVDREINDVNFIKEAASTSSLSEDSLEGEVVQIGSAGYLLLKNGEVAEDAYFSDYNKAQQEAVARAAICKREGKEDEFAVVELNSKFISRDKIEINETSEAVIYKTGESAKVKEIINIGEFKEQADSAKRIWGPKDNPAGICIDFKKYKYEYPGSWFPGKVIATNWCQRYNKPCPVLGADATDPTCLRNLYGKAYETELDRVATNFNEKHKKEYEELIELYNNPSPPVEDVEDDPKPLEIPDNLEQEVNEIPPIRPINVADDEEPLNLEPLEQERTFSDLYEEISSLPREERAKLDNSHFGIPAKRQFPLHTEKLVKSTMDLYPEISRALKTATSRKELFNNIIVNSLRLGIDTTKFEKESAFKFKEFSEEYGIPRLKMYPLNTREQIIAAMSRYPVLKAEVTEEEKERCVINILRAATKHKIDCSRFREKYKK